MPRRLEGQVQAGAGLGAGQAMLQRCVYDAETGQLVTGFFTDYCLPRADDLPAIGFAYNVVPCRTNPLGIEHLDMPLTPERVWSAIRAAGKKRTAKGVAASAR